MATKNVMGRERRVYKGEKPYIVTEDPRMPGWRWEVLKTWQIDGRKPYARAFCSVSSPMIDGNSELGDCYVTDVGHVIVDFDPEVFESAKQAAGALFGTS